MCRAVARARHAGGGELRLHPLRRPIRLPAVSADRPGGGQAEPRRTPSEQTRVRPRRRDGRDLTLLEDISTIITHAQDLRGTLERIVEVIAERMDTEVCSLYLYDPAARRLTLWATTGLDRSTVGRVSMGVEGGL